MITRRQAITQTSCALLGMALPSWKLTSAQSAEAATQAAAPSPPGRPADPKFSLAHRVQSSTPQSGHLIAGLGT